MSTPENEEVSYWGENTADTVFNASMVTAQLAEPVHAPDQPLNWDMPPSSAARVTVEPSAKFAAQVPDWQDMPAGEELTVPPPDTFTTSVCGLSMNRAVADLEASMVTEQVPVPLQAPIQPAKMLSVVGVAVRMTDVPLE